MGGGTHARKMPNAVPYGPGPVKGSALSENHKFGHAHSHDEAVYIPSLLDAVKIYAVTLIRLDKLLTP
jgi:succinyl-diaminopimelate desuccinylase